MTHIAAATSSPFIAMVILQCSKLKFSVLLLLYHTSTPRSLRSNAQHPDSTHSRHCRKVLFSFHTVTDVVLCATSSTAEKLFCRYLVRLHTIKVLALVALNTNDNGSGTCFAHNVSQSH